MNKTIICEWLKTWVINLIDVYLFAAALNCLFQWLARGTTNDLLGFILSLIVAVSVYFVSVTQKNNDKINKRVCVALALLVIWSVIMPFCVNYGLQSASKSDKTINSTNVQQKE